MHYINLHGFSGYRFRRQNTKSRPFRLPASPGIIGTAIHRNVNVPIAAVVSRRTFRDKVWAASCIIKVFRGTEERVSQHPFNIYSNRSALTYSRFQSPTRPTDIHDISLWNFKCDNASSQRGWSCSVGRCVFFSAIYWNLIINVSALESQLKGIFHFYATISFI